ncbi:MAG: phosphatidylinositol mannoside acyltransferase [Candidatus Anoxymicrobium japonicum]|uniref:Phosphatidylinositol mannoside acyltransferase n=1 Tax=Candidatus Anoxymicrobium japonicum TaxID=2013648 RepID=A0A2N3G7Y4_9ACTN|nr:MAG: phosphatidylinositol mannoside acyltransferase [Candidatus Anoxymicrobium japonicum]
MKIVYYMFVLGEKVVSALPIGLTRAVARACGVVYFYVFPRKRRLVLRNMRRVLGPDATSAAVKRAACRACRSYADYWVDVIWLPTRTRDYVLERFDTINVTALEEVMAGGKGAIFVLPHYGSWEVGAVYVSSLGPLVAVAEALKPPELFDMFCRLRADVGVEIFPYDRRSETRDKLVEVLKKGAAIALLCDRDLKGSGVPVEFFGEQTTLPPGPAVLAMRSGSPIFCAAVRNLKGNRWSGRVLDPIYVDGSGDREEIVQATMQQIAGNLEVLIREDPTQWHMFMPAWPSDR